MSAIHYFAGGALLLGIFALAYVLAPKGWRTVVFNALAAVPLVLLPLLDQLTGVDWAALLGDNGGAFVSAALLLCNIVLRFVTTTPVGQKKDDA